MGHGEGPHTPHYRLNGVRRRSLRCHAKPLMAPEAGRAVEAQRALADHEQKKPNVGTFVRDPAPKCVSRSAGWLRTHVAGSRRTRIGLWRRRRLRLGVDPTQPIRSIAALEGQREADLAARAFRFLRRLDDPLGERSVPGQHIGPRFVFAGVSTAAGICTGAAAQKCTTGSVVACPRSPWEGPARGATRPRRGWRRPARGRGLWAHGVKRGVIRTVAGVVTGSA